MPLSCRDPIPVDFLGQGCLTKHRLWKSFFLPFHPAPSRPGCLTALKMPSLPLQIDPESGAILPLMKFKVLQDNLRKILWQRIETGELTGLRLAQQTGFKQAHISNFLNRKRGLSLEGMDKVQDGGRVDVQTPGQDQAPAGGERRGGRGGRGRGQKDSE